MNARDTEIQIRNSSHRITLPRERRYPLDLMRRRRDVYDCYLESNAGMWDIDGDVRWKAFVVSGHSPAACDAASYIWSWQSWVAFRDITTCEAALVRACLEPDVSADLKFCMSTRASERAAAADGGAELAGLIGTYRERPQTVELESLFDTDMVRRVLHEGVSLDALILSHFATVPTVDRAVAEARLARVKEPTVSDLLSHIVDDLRRQERWAWTYLTGRLEEIDTYSLNAISRNLAEVLQQDLLLGARWTALIDDHVAGARALAIAEALAAEEGLGGLAAADGIEAVRTALDEVVEQLGKAGVPLTPVTEVLSAHHWPRTRDAG